MTLADLDTVVEVHLQSFDGFFLSSLGSKFLGLYYRGILDFAQIAFVAEEGREILGFTTGIANSFSFYRRLLRRRGPSFVWAAVPALVRRPRFVARRLVQGLWKKPAGGISAADEDAVTLTAIAVAENGQGKGVGRLLLRAFEDEARLRGFRRVFLETDAEANAAVINFYERAGFSLNRRYTTADGRQMLEFVALLGESSPVGSGHRV